MKHPHENFLRTPLFLNDAKNLTTYGCTLWCSQIVYIRPYSFNTATAFYFATECSNVTVFVWGRVHAAIVPYFTCLWPGLDSISYSGCSVVPSVTGERTIVLRKCL